LSFEEIATAYASIIADLDEMEIAAIWAASLFSRRPGSARIGARVEQLEALRKRIGDEKAAEHARGRNARSADTYAA